MEGESTTLEETVISLLTYAYTRQQIAALPILLEYLEQDFMGEAGSIAPFEPVDVYRSVMHIFQLFPSSMDVMAVRRILLKSMLLLPSPEFLGMSLCVPAGLHFHQNIAPVLELAKLLEDGHIQKFWEKLYAVKPSAVVDDGEKGEQRDEEVLEPSLQFADFLACPGVLDAIRRFIVDLVSISYSQMSVEYFCKFLNVEDGSDEFKKLVAIAEANVISPSEISGKSVASSDCYIKFNFPHDQSTSVTNYRGFHIKSAVISHSLNQQQDKYFSRDAVKNYSAILTSKTT